MFSLREDINFHKYHINFALIFFCVLKNINVRINVLICVLINVISMNCHDLLPTAWSYTN